MTPPTGRLLLLDSASLYFRAFFGVPTSITAPDGMPVNAVRGLLDMIARLVTDRRPTRLVACWGNNDGAVLRSRLPERADVVLDGVRFTIVHETGATAGRDARMSRQYPDTDVLVFGHSHIPWDTTTSTGLRLLNPGSPTDRRRQPFCTYMTGRVDGGALIEVALHRLAK